MKRLIICAALPIEIKSLCQQLKIDPPSKFWLFDSTVYGNHSLIIGNSGIGRISMQKFLLSLPSEPVDCWISTGFSGALIPELENGEVVVGNEVVSLHGYSVKPPSPPSINNVQGSPKLLCVHRMVCKAAEKKHFHELTGAALVDMESMAVAEHALNRQEPFVWIRAISDKLNEKISEKLLDVFDANGFSSTTKSIKTLIKNPHLVPVCIKMGIRTSRLSSNLAKTMLDFIQKI